MKNRWCVLLGALLLASAPGVARAAGSEEWPTTPDRGPGTATKIPWLRFSGDPTAPVVVASGRAVHAQQVVLVGEPELSRRQQRLLRRAERHAAKAAELRRKVGDRRGAYAVVVPVVQPTPPAPPQTVVVEHRRPKVQVVRLEREHVHDGCDESELAAEVEALEAEVEALQEEDEDDDEGRSPVVIDVERLSEDVERQVEQALRDAERAQEQAGRAQEQAERARERSQEQAERARERAREQAGRARERSRRDAERGRR